MTTIHEVAYIQNYDQPIIVECYTYGYV